MTERSLVIDTSIVVKWFLKEPFERESLWIRDAFRNKECSLLAPDLIYSEFANTIWKRINFNGLDPDEGTLMIADFIRLPLEIISSNELLIKAFSLAIEFKRSVYDAIFLSLSLIKMSPFVTADKKFYNALHLNFPNIIWISDCHIFNQSN